jgi:hypothetical protein
VSHLDRLDDPHDVVAGEELLMSVLKQHPVAFRSPLGLIRT